MRTSKKRNRTRPQIGFLLLLSWALLLGSDTGETSYSDPLLAQATAHESQRHTDSTTTTSSFRLLIIPVYFALDPDCDLNCPVGDYECDNFQPLLWRPSLANIQNTYFCECDIDPCDHCVANPCDAPPCGPLYPQASQLSISDYFHENSFEMLLLEGDVTNHYELFVDVCPSNITVIDEIAEAAVAAAQSDLTSGPQPGIGWDIALDTEGRIISDTYDGLIILHPQVPYHNYFGWTERTKRIIWQDSVDWRVGCHELGHLMADAIGHSGAWECPDSTWGDHCIQAERSDYHDVMGYGHGHFKVPWKRKYGWIDEDQILTLHDSESGVYTLTPLEAPDGLKAIRVPREAEFYHFEFRQPIGEIETQSLQQLIRELPGLESWTLDGLIPYRTLGGASGKTLLLDLSPNSIPGTNQKQVVADHLDGMLRAGQTYFDPKVGFMSALELRNPGTEQAEIDLEVIFTQDCNHNRIADACDVDCQGLGGLCDVAGCGSSSDCNHNGIPDECEIDCNDNNIPDDCDIESGAAADCNQNAIPDTCEEAYQDCNDNDVHDQCDVSSGHSLDVLPPQGDGVPDECQIDCNANSIPDELDLLQGVSQDCNENHIPDECDIESGFSADLLPVSGDGIPDECQTDCNENGLPDAYELAIGSASDCNRNDILDVCDLASGTAKDCNMNQVPDSCEGYTDCNRNAVWDYCDIESGTSLDVLLPESDGIPDECQLDCNLNGILDSHDIQQQTSPDENQDGFPDECELSDVWTKITASDGFEGDLFGTSVGLSNEFMIVGTGSTQGSHPKVPYILQNDGAAWNEQSRLFPADGNISHFFGWHTAISGNLAVAGAENDSDAERRAGAVYVFRFDGSGWQQEAKLTANDATENAHFGQSVDISNDRIIVGAPNAHSDVNYSGAAYIYEFDGLTWMQDAKLAAPDAGPWDQFGYFVAISGNHAIVGAPGKEGERGAAYIYYFDGSTWAEQTKLTALDGVAQDRLGTRVSLLNDIAIVGTGKHQRATVYFYRFANLTWTQEATLSILNDSTWAFYVPAVDNNIALVGAAYNDGQVEDSGAAYVLLYDGNRWNLQAKLAAPDGGAEDRFGGSVDLAEGTAIISSMLDEDLGEFSGSVYIFSGLSDCDNNGILDAFQLRDAPDTDCNGNRKLDVCDIAEFHSEDIVPLGGDGIPDECQADCNGNGRTDDSDLASGLSRDCTGNNIPDECEQSPDCNLNAHADHNDICEARSEDCNLNGRPDECDILSGSSSDTLPPAGDGIPDDCQADCNANNLPDAYEIQYLISSDINANGQPDECEVTLSVPDDYPTIQSAVNAAPHGSFILLDPGVYTGTGNRNMQVNGKQLVIAGRQGPEKTIIDCEGTHRAFNIWPSNTEGTYLYGLTIQNGFANESGGAINSSANDICISNCILRNNSTTRNGGAISIQGTQVRVENCLIAGNSALVSGGAISVHGGSTHIRSCTLVDNDAPIADGVFFSTGEHELTNTILWNHAGPRTQLGLTSTMGSRGSGINPVSLRVSYCDLLGGEARVYFGSLEGITFQFEENNISAAPRFVTAGGMQYTARPDYRLRMDSPCVNAGDSHYAAVAGMSDLDGDPRIQNGRVDIGADEIPDDCNENGEADRTDVAFGRSPDCNRNGRPDECDISATARRPPVSEDCNDNGIPDECEFAPCIDCDINGDGKIDKQDRVFMNECIAEPNPDLCRTADLDGNGKVTKHDLTLLQQCFSDEGSHMQLEK